jgi:hypothetical protein
LKTPTPEQALASAAQQAGSDDFGPRDFEPGLTRVLHALDRMPLIPQAHEVGVHKVIGDLATRARIEAWYRAHPDIEHRRIEGPVLVCGMPRTGTTAVVGMLALDERFRFLRGWEGAAPLPPPIAGQEATDPRLMAARARARLYEKPEMHLHDPDGPEEDLVFLAGLSMRSFYGTLPMPQDYVDWWVAEDFGSTYAYNLRVMKLLNSQRPPELWLIKAPIHLFKLADFARQFPAARFVMTHRDPLKIIPSAASLHHRLYQDRCRPGTLDKRQIGERTLALWQEGMRRGLAARAAIGEERFIDVHNDDVVQRPLESFERIYQHLGLPLGAGLRQRIEGYSRRNPPGAFGVHRYTLEEYGLTAAGIRLAFRDYIDRFCHEPRVSS